MPKVLYISHMNENSGWGQAARDYILAMDAVGIDVVPRSIKMGNPTAIIPERIKTLQEKSSVGCDVVVQHVLPHLMDYNGRFKKNIALYITETMGWYHSGWNDLINRLDAAWVPNLDMLDEATENDVRIPVSYIPHACDITRYTRSYNRLEIEPTNGNFVFYTIGEFNRRKRLPALIQAFHREFTKNEPVSLVIKTNKTGHQPKQLFDEVNKLCTEVKRAYKLHPDENQYHDEIVIPQFLPEDELFGLHTLGDCFILPSFGEAWSIPTFDAMAMNKYVIAGNFGGPATFLRQYSALGKGYLLDADAVPVTGMYDTFPNLNTGREMWWSVCINHMQECMRDAYNRTRKPFMTGLECAKEFSYEKVGEMILKELEC